MSGIKCSYYNNFLIFFFICVFAVYKTLAQGRPCTTLKGKPGNCVPILTCQTITQLFDSSPIPLPTSVSNQVRQSHCGIYNNTHHVCCEQTHTTARRPSLEPSTTVEAGPCTTLQKESGICVPIVRCQTITSLFDNSPRPLPQSVSDQVRQSYCGTFNNIHHACCNQFNVTGETPSPVPSAEESRFTAAEGGPCTTLERSPGTCVPIDTCRTNTQLPDSVSEQVPHSHCGTFNDIHHVCCDPSHVNVKPPVTTSNHVTRPGIIEKSKNELATELALLQATACGRHDRHSLPAEDLEYHSVREDGSMRGTTVCIGYGFSADLSEFPWMALLVYFDGANKTMDCGGSLIHEKYVLTAAHCIRVQRKKLVSVRLGEQNTKVNPDCFIECPSIRRCAPPMQEIDVEEAIYHQDYNPGTLSNDIGILRLKSNAVIAINVKPICLPLTRASTPFLERRMIISGWGRMENGRQATVLQKANVPSRNIDFCQKAHKLVRLTSKHRCAGGENRYDTCRGDSGGPLFGYGSYEYSEDRRHIQYGVVSAGGFTCGSDSPGIYVNVEAYLLWIASNINFSTTTDNTSTIFVY